MNEKSLTIIKFIKEINDSPKKKIKNSQGFS